jgi:hypothetical protein
MPFCCTWTCLHHKGLCCTWMCLHNRGFCCTTGPLKCVPWEIYENHGILRNFVQFCTEYGRYVSTKNRRNSVLTEFRGHPRWPAVMAGGAFNIEPSQQRIGRAGGGGGWVRRRWASLGSSSVPDAITTTSSPLDSTRLEALMLASLS